MPWQVPSRLLVWFGVLLGVRTRDGPASSNVGLPRLLVVACYLWPLVVHMLTVLRRMTSRLLLVVVRVLR